MTSLLLLREYAHLVFCPGGVAMSGPLLQAGSSFPFCYGRLVLSYHFIFPLPTRPHFTVVFGIATLPLTCTQQITKLLERSEHCEACPYPILSNTALKFAQNSAEPGYATNPPPHPTAPLSRSTMASQDEAPASYHLSQPLPAWVNPAYAKHIVKGNFMTLIARPKTVEHGEWIAHQCVEHYRNLWHFVRVIYEKEDKGTSICNPTTCPKMSAGP